MVEFLYDDQFTIKKQDPDGKKFDRGLFLLFFSFFLLFGASVCEF